MRCKDKLINRAHPLQNKPRSDQNFRIARKTDGIAGNGNDFFNRRRRDLFALGFRTGTRRVKNHAFETVQFLGIKRRVEQVPFLLFDSVGGSFPLRL